MQLPFSSPSSSSASAPLGSPSDLCAEPSWRDYFLDLSGGNRIHSAPQRAYFLNAAQIGQFHAPLSAGFEFFSGRCIRWGITTRADLPPGNARRLASSLAAGGLRIPGVATSVRAVCRSGFIFYVVDEARGDEPILPADWMASCEVEGDQPHAPRWVGCHRLAFEQQATAKVVGATAPWLSKLDESLYERRTFGWRLKDSLPLPELFSEAVQPRNT